MIRSYVFAEGKLAGQEIDPDALRLVRGDKGLYLWVDLDDPTEEESRQILENVFGFHPLAIEDCLAVSHMPKIEEYDNYLFIVMHAVDFNRKDSFHSTELDLFIGKDFIVTHHTHPLRSIDTIRDRVSKSGIPAFKAMDKLSYNILSTLVDNYQPVMDELGKAVMELEDMIFSSSYPSEPAHEIMHEFRTIRNQVNKLRQIIRPQREVISRIAHGEFKIIRPPLIPYYRDIYDELSRIDEVGHALNDQLFLSFDVFLNRAANETNEVIKLLTLLTAITTPSMLIGTWYGMNFEPMPELKWKYGYEAAALTTIVSTVALMLWLRWKKWL
ncbi:MAG: magnesium/cobalt transporter CorA [Candidatus Methylacidiphilales bacterium]|nr:magnesium/cobalt transporter CorA [Candidatus Methylacidiphilales bacterium]